MWRRSLLLVQQSRPGFRHFRSRRALPASDLDPSQINTRLGKSLAFTAGSAAVFYTGSTLWLYEQQQHPKKPKKRSFSNAPKWYDKLEPVKWWKSQKPAMKLYYGILGINGAVLLMWKIPRFSGFMCKYFTHSPTSNLVSPMLLSTFSHKSILHCGCNMLVLHSFIGPAVEVMGLEQFTATYLTGGIVASFVSHLGKIYSRNPVTSLGASGAILTAIGIVCVAFPDARMQVILLPMLTFKAITGIKGLILVDFVGVLRKWSFFDHAAHLGGALYGIGYSLGGYKLYFAYSTYLIKIWHSIRGGKQDS